MEELPIDNCEVCGLRAFWLFGAQQWVHDGKENYDHMAVPCRLKSYVTHPAMVERWEKKRLGSDGHRE